MTLAIRSARYFSGGFFISFLLFAGCSTTLQSRELLYAPPAALAEPVELTDVAFFPQEEFQCGPAALATILDWSNVPVTPAVLKPQVYLPERHGSLQVELLAASRRHGRLPYLLPKELKAVLSEVRAGNPVLVLQNLAFNWFPIWHYAVVVGFDLEKDRIILRSGPERRHIVSMKLFERTWRRGERWAVVVTPPDRLPVTAKELPFLQAVTVFEQLGDWQTANSAYSAATDRWPDSLGAWMGLGNSFYAQSEYAKAVAAFRVVLSKRSDYTPVLNNLAQVLSDMGRLKAAERYALQAVDAGGPHSSIYAETLKQIRKKLEE